MRSANLAPIDTKGAVGSLGDKGDLLAQVKIGVSFAIASLDFDQRNTVILSAEGTLVTEDGTIHVQTGGSLGSHLFIL